METSLIMQNDYCLFICISDSDFVYLFIFLIKLAGEIKEILQTELGIPASKMQLKGWKSGDVNDGVSF